MALRSEVLVDADLAACPFCTLPPTRVWLEDEHAVVFRDGYQISPGHTLVIPKVHVASLFDLDADEQAAVWAMVARIRQVLAAKHGPDAFNIGLNDGVSAGQTVMHAHVHVIPRYDGDVDDPHGGVRWIIPDKAAYWDNE